MLQFQTVRGLFFSEHNHARMVLCKAPCLQHMITHLYICLSLVAATHAYKGNPGAPGTLEGHSLLMISLQILLQCGGDKPVHPETTLGCGCRSGVGACTGGCRGAGLAPQKAGPVPTSPPQVTPTLMGVPGEHSLPAGLLSTSAHDF